MSQTLGNAVQQALGTKPAPARREAVRAAFIAATKETSACALTLQTSTARESEKYILMYADGFSPEEITKDAVDGAYVPGMADDVKKSAARSAQLRIATCTARVKELTAHGIPLVRADGSLNEPVTKNGTPPAPAEKDSEGKDIPGTGNPQVARALMGYAQTLATARRSAATAKGKADAAAAAASSVTMESDGQPTTGIPADQIPQMPTKPAVIAEPSVVTWARHIGELLNTPDVEFSATVRNMLLDICPDAIRSMAQELARRAIEADAIASAAKLAAEKIGAAIGANVPDGATATTAASDPTATAYVAPVKPARVRKARGKSVAAIVSEAPEWSDSDTAETAALILGMAQA